jgi:hypothetical protein
MENAIGTEREGVKLVAQKPYSAHEADAYLSVVGGVLQLEAGQWQGITWLRAERATAQGSYCFEGVYSLPVATRAEALRLMVASFNERGLQGGSVLFVMPDAR